MKSVVSRAAPHPTTALPPPVEAASAPASAQSARQTLPGDITVPRGKLSRTRALYGGEGGPEGPGNGGPRVPGSPITPPKALTLEMFKKEAKSHDRRLNSLSTSEKIFSFAKDASLVVAAAAASVVMPILAPIFVLGAVFGIIARHTSAQTEFKQQLWSKFNQEKLKDYVKKYGGGGEIPLRFAMACDNRNVSEQIKILEKIQKTTGKTIDLNEYLEKAYNPSREAEVEVEGSGHTPSTLTTVPSPPEMGETARLAKERIEILKKNENWKFVYDVFGDRLHSSDKALAKKAFYEFKKILLDEVNRMEDDFHQITNNPNRIEKVKENLKSCEAAFDFLYEATPEKIRSEEGLFDFRMRFNRFKKSHEKILILEKNETLKKVYMDNWQKIQEREGFLEFLEAIKLEVEKIQGVLLVSEPSKTKERLAACEAARELLTYANSSEVGQGKVLFDLGVKITELEHELKENLEELRSLADGMEIDESLDLFTS